MKPIHPLKPCLSDNKGCISLFNEGAFVIVPMEQAIIKKRIEAMGTPLKDWDVSINYGVLKQVLMKLLLLTALKKMSLLRLTQKMRRS